uniref:Uncharacterized protein n=1 Tax=Amphimedon queenslandica TaxID=400682 RepID=A0A1X7USN5_AMPQE
MAENEDVLGHSKADETETLRDPGSSSDNPRTGTTTIKDTTQADDRSTRMMLQMLIEDCRERYWQFAEKLLREQELRRQNEEVLEEQWRKDEETARKDSSTGADESAPGSGQRNLCSERGYIERARSERQGRESG